MSKRAKRVTRRQGKKIRSARAEDDQLSLESFAWATLMYALHGKTFEQNKHGAADMKEPLGIVVDPETRARIDDGSVRFEVVLEGRSLVFVEERDALRCLKPTVGGDDFSMMASFYRFQQDPDKVLFAAWHHDRLGFGSKNINKVHPMVIDTIRYWIDDNASRIVGDHGAKSLLACMRPIDTGKVAPESTR